MGNDILFVWLLRRSAFLNLDNESNFLIAMSSLFHSFTVKEINEELVIESIYKGTIKWLGLEVLVFNINCNNKYTCYLKDPNSVYNPNIAYDSNLLNVINDL